MLDELELEELLDVELELELELELLPELSSVLQSAAATPSPCTVSESIFARPLLVFALNITSFTPAI